MLEITNSNYIPFSMIKNSKDPGKDPDVIIYPDIFNGKISDIMLKKLAELECTIIKFCISDKLITSSKKMLWFADDPSWTFVYSNNHMIGLQSEKFPLFIRCIQIAVEELTEQKFNSCVLSVYEIEDDSVLSEKEDHDWYGDIEASITFGGNSLFHLDNKTNRKNNLLIPTRNGSIIIIREGVKKYWEHNIQIKKGIRFNLRFRNITKKLLDLMPKAKTNCGGKNIVHFKKINQDVLLTKQDSQIKYSYLPSPLDETITLSDIYLNNDQRYALISQIKKAMAGSIKSDGDQCVNGLKPTLLKQLELKRFLGRGTFANVYAACSPAPCRSDAYKFAVKLTIIPDEEFKYYYSTNKPSWHEPYILKNMINPLVIKGICPNLPLLAESYTCSDCDFKFNDAEDVETNKKASCLILLMELGTGGDMSGWLKRDKAPSEEEILISLFQIMAGVHAIQIYGQILNNDIKAQNILSYNIKSGGYWHYVIHGQNFYVPNMGKLFVLNDFGVSRVFNPNHKLSYLLKEKWVNLGNRYAMIINGKYSPLNAKNPVDNKLPRVKLIHWEHSDKNAGSKTIEIAKSKGGIAKISVSDKNEIYNPNIEFTSEQLKELKRLGIPADSGNKEFYNHPKVIPPLQLIGDTQDVILTFTGGKRATQPGNHASYDSIPQNIKKLLEPYVIKRYVNGGHYIDDDPSKGMAGYFITDFFTRIHEYTQLPIGEKLIATYNIS